MNKLEVIEGIVEKLERTSHVSGGGSNSHASTTHITLFHLGERRVSLSLPSPPPISDGDTVRLVGLQHNGVFSTRQCLNLTTSWLSPLPKNGGCALAALTFFLIITSLISFFASILALPFPLMIGFLMFKMNQHDSAQKKARKLLLQK